MTRSIATIAAIVTLAAGCNQNAAHHQIAEARRLTAELVTQFSRSADASSRAVMADSDDLSAASAREARAAVEAVQRSSGALAQLLAGLRYSDELELLRQFEQRFADYRTVDNEILTLVVEGTNSKARRLSVVDAQQAADALRDALQRVVPARPADSWHVKALAAAALASAREVQVLHAPHIAEVDDAEMTKLEARMTDAETSARQALEELGRLVPADSKAQVAAAFAELDRLSKLNLEIKTLSRRNTNVRALALSLGQKRVTTAACEESLQALQAAIGKRGLPTR